MSNIAIVVIGFNRITSISRLLKSLEHADYASDKVDLIISIDKSDSNVVELYADDYQWSHGNKKVITHDENLGLRAHILSQGKLFEFYDTLVILEDDVVVSPLFYHYAKQTVDMYKEEDSIAGISLYAYHVNYQNNLPFEPIKSEYDVYFMQCAMSWGQIWMKRQWLAFYDWYLRHTSFDYSCKIPESLYTWPESSWLKYHIRYCIERNKYFVYPYFSLVTNFSDVGTHNNDTANNTVYQVPMQRGHKLKYLLPSFDEHAIKYDGFFECELLIRYLDPIERDCCVDLYGTKRNMENKKYWLTSRSADYKIVKSFGINYRPLEANIIENNPGRDVFLYDTTQSETNCRSDNREVIMFRFYIQNVLSFMRIYGIYNYFIEPVKISLIKIFKYLKRKYRR